MNARYHSLGLRLHGAYTTYFLLKINIHSIKNIHFIQYIFYLVIFGYMYFNPHYTIYTTLLPLPAQRNLQAIKFLQQPSFLLFLILT